MLESKTNIACSCVQTPTKHRGLRFSECITGQGGNSCPFSEKAWGLPLPNLGRCYAEIWDDWSERHSKSPGNAKTRKTRLTLKTIQNINSRAILKETTDTRMHNSIGFYLH